MVVSGRLAWAAEWPLPAVAYTTCSGVVIVNRSVVIRPELGPDILIEEDDVGNVSVAVGKYDANEASFEADSYVLQIGKEAWYIPEYHTVELVILP